MKNYSLKSSLITIAIIALSQFAKAQSIISNDICGLKEKLVSSLHESELKKDSIGIANAYQNLGSYYAFIDKRDTAIVNYGIAEIIYKLADDTAGIIASGFNSSMLYFSKGKYYIGINGLLSVLNLAELTKDSSRISDCFSNLGMGYYDLNQYTVALKYMLKNLELSKQINDQHKIKDAYKNLAKIYEKLSSIDVAAKYNQLYDNLDESLAKN